MIKKLRKKRKFKLEQPKCSNNFRPLKILAKKCLTHTEDKVQIRGLFSNPTNLKLNFSIKNKTDLEKIVWGIALYGSGGGGSTEKSYSLLTRLFEEQGV